MGASGIVARRLLLRWLPVAVLLVAALTIGLLGMHTVSGPDGHRPAVSDALPLAASGAPTLPEHAQAQPCECAAPSPDHSSVLMSCVLALLAGLLVVTPRRWTGALTIPLTRGGAMLEHDPGAIPRPRPPSLIFLSISRT
ncbi:DUF6153 family protein [Agrococcus sp. SCSIO52902]|uniref:DUF6153 family protein n=1 Tax=Agrococcus sp. SCSIO52902 TaxID=2933290 RepID=UPI001FF2ECE0|nr:DUF6153 family protein [Agrococcus sp. SCSIO52902]UOV99836.1 DUF6153 family protein [Agrococcus sp. SCSIO52902]